MEGYAMLTAQPEEKPRIMSSTAQQHHLQGPFYSCPAILRGFAIRPMMSNTQHELGPNDFNSLGFDPRPHLANFHAANAGPTPPPPPLQHPEEPAKAKGAGRGGAVKVQNQTQGTDFSNNRNLLAIAAHNSVAFPGVEANKVAPANTEKQEDNSLKDKLWPCPSCKVPFKAASELQAHLSAHTKGEKSVPCEICGKLFASAERVRIHVRAAHGEKSCSCDICGSGFSYRCKLLDHMRTHTGDKPFHCDVCGKSFSQKNHLTRHSMIHTGERPYPCDFCGRGFYRKDKLTRHRRIHTVSPSNSRASRGPALGQMNTITTTSGANLTSLNNTINTLANNSLGSSTSNNNSSSNTAANNGNPIKLSPSSSPNPSPSLSPSHFRTTSAYKPDWQGAPSGVH